MKLAAGSPAGARLLAALGIEPVLPVPASSAQLAAAFAEGLDGFAAEAEAEAAAAARGGTAFLDLRALFPREVVVANRAAFDPLDADAKTALIACGDKAAAESMAAARAADTAARSAL
ncbi:hypothetical protein J8J27_23665, partial [Mycobacterium tuberculosis]|nr:hypothetical protein [Mycobacterium tuberculosis]